MEHEIGILGAIYASVELIKWKILSKSGETVTQQIGELHDWHSAKDTNTGAPIWYRENLKDDIKELRLGISEMQTIARGIEKDLTKESRESHNEIMSKVQKILSIVERIST